MADHKKKIDQLKLKAKNVPLRDKLKNQVVIPKSGNLYTNIKRGAPVLEKKEPKLNRLNLPNLIIFFNGIFIIFLFSLYFYYSNISAEIITIKNNTPYSQKFLEDKLALTGKSFSAVDSYEVSKILSSLPWVELGKVKKMPPAIIAYHIEARTPIATILSAGKRYLIDKDQVLIAETTDHNPALPELYVKNDDYKSLQIGVRLNSLNLKWAFLWLDELQKNEVLNLAAIKKFDVSNPYHFVIQTNKPYRLVFKYDDIDNQLLRLKTIEANLAKIAKKPEELDLRFPDRVIIR